MNWRYWADGILALMLIPILFIGLLILLIPCQFLRFFER